MKVSHKNNNSQASYLPNPSKPNSFILKVGSLFNSLSKWTYNLNPLKKRDISQQKIKKSLSTHDLDVKIEHSTKKERELNIKINRSHDLLAHCSSVSNTMMMRIGLPQAHEDNIKTRSKVLRDKEKLYAEKEKSFSKNRPPPVLES